MLPVRANYARRLTPSLVLFDKHPRSWPVNTLLVDFGASRIKCALWSHEDQAIVAVCETHTPSVQSGLRGEAEGEPEAYWQALEETGSELLKTHSQVEALWLCTEMHGFLIGSALDGVPYTKYLSWRDDRSCYSQSGGPSTLERLSPSNEAFFKISGMRLKAGLPILTLADLKQGGLLPPTFRLFTLADWLMWRGGERDPAIHPSLAASTGLFDIAENLWSAPLLRLAGMEPDGIVLPRISPVGARLGHITLCGRHLSVYGGIGDLQAAAQGAGFPTAGSLLVNLGTGSQVLLADSMVPPSIERRPGIWGDQFGAITHIPSGRALNVFAAFIDGCATANGGQPFFWKRFAELTVELVLAEKVEIDLNVFESAWNYRNGGAILAIHEGSFKVDKLLANLAKSWLAQYVTAMDILDPDHIQSCFLLAGGLSRRGRFIRPALEILSRRKAIVREGIAGEETLDGLLGLAIICTNLND